MISSRVEYDLAPGIAGREFISPSTKRVTITFFPPRVGGGWVSNDVQNNTAQGLALFPGGQPITLRVDLHGDCVQRGWYATYLAGSEPIAYIQGLG